MNTVISKYPPNILLFRGIYLDIKINTILKMLTPKPLGTPIIKEIFTNE